MSGARRVAAFRVSSSICSGQADLKTNLKFKAKNQTETRNRNPNRNMARQHKPPSRGVFRIVTGIALRAAALYFRYGGLATSVLNFARGASAAHSILSLRWSGLKTRFDSFDLTTLASNSAKNYVTNRIYAYGSIARAPNLLNRVGGLQVINPNIAAKSQRV